VKICAVTSSFPRYEGDSAGIFVYNIIVGISKKHEVHVIYPADVKIQQDEGEPFYRHKISYPFKTYPMAQVHGLDLINVAPLLINYAREIRCVKQKYNIDLLHAFWTIPCGFISSLCCGEIPLVMTLEGSDMKVFGRQWISKYFIKRAQNKSRKIIALSNDLKHEAIKLGTQEDKIYVIPDGVDTNKFKPMDKSVLRAELHLPKGFLILFVGSLFKLKRVDRLIQISANLSKDFNFHVLIVGDGPERQKLKRLAESLGLKNILFKGSVPHKDMPFYMAASDVLVLPSETEGLPGCVQEAMACGIPIVASNVGGLPDLITNGATGYLANDEVEMERYLRQIISSPESISLMATNVLTFARQNLSLDNVVERIEEVYELVRIRKGREGGTRGEQGGAGERGTKC